MIAPKAYSSALIMNTSLHSSLAIGVQVESLTTDGCKINIKIFGVSAAMCECVCKKEVMGK